MPEAKRQNNHPQRSLKGLRDDGLEDWLCRWSGRNHVKAMKKIQGQSTSNPSSISQAAALEAISGDQSFINYDG